MLLKKKTLEKLHLGTAPSLGRYSCIIVYTANKPGSPNHTKFYQSWIHVAISFTCLKSCLDNKNNDLPGILNRMNQMIESEVIFFFIVPLLLFGEDGSSLDLNKGEEIVLRNLFSHCSSLTQFYLAK